MPEEYITLMHAFNTDEDFPYHLETVLRERLYKGYGQFDALYPAIIDTIQSTKNKERYMGLQADLELIETKALEPFKDASMGEKEVEVYNHKFGRTISFPLELIEDDDRAIFSFIPEKFGEAAKRVLDRAVFTELTASANYNVAKGNLVQTNTSLTYEGLKEAWELFMAQTDVNGQPIVIEPDTLVVPYTLYIDAWKLMGTPELVDTTAEARGAGVHDKGSHRYPHFFAGRFNVIRCPYLTDTNAWYLIKAKSWGVLQERVPLEISATTTTNDMVIKWDAYMTRARIRFGVGTLDHKFLVKSAGT
jgi:phage major head subunit gpT-like protein